MTTTLVSSTTALRIEPWHDPVIDRLGYDPRSSYAEQFWLPILGPSTTFFLRLAAGLLAEQPEGTELDPGEIARRLGLGERSGRNAPFARTLQRCCDFDMATALGPSVLGVRTRLPPLARRHLLRLTPALREQHDHAVALPAGPPSPGVEVARRRGCQLALTLLELGEDVEAAERQLLDWQYHPALASQCVQLAATTRARRGGPVACKSAD
jgi:hypothetical protein